MRQPIISTPSYRIRQCSTRNTRTIQYCTRNASKFLNRIYQTTVTPLPGTIHAFEGTLGGGGHTQLLLKSLPNIRMLSTDIDPILVSMAQTKFADYITNSRLKVICKNYCLLNEETPFHPVTTYDLIFVDLGMSNFHLCDAERGFSYKMDGPLDMKYRYGNIKHPMARDIVIR